LSQAADDRAAPARPARKMSRETGGSALVDDDVVEQRVRAPGVLVAVGDVGDEAGGVAGGEVVDLLGDAQAELAAEHGDALAGAGGVGLGAVDGAGGEAELVDLDAAEGAGGREGAALDLAVGGPQDALVG